MAHRLTAEQLSSMREGRRERRDRAELRRKALLAEAEHDASAIIRMVADRYGPDRVYQWGSLVETDHFRETSDIDLAVEGVDDPRELFALIAEAERLTRFPVDIVQIERVHPRYAELIRRHGRLVYERC